MKVNYIALFFIKYSRFLFAQPIYANESFLTIFIDFVDTFPLDDIAMTMLSAMMENKDGSYCISWDDFLIAYNILRIKYGLEEKQNEKGEYFLVISTEQEEAFCKQFSQEEIVYAETFAWYFYNYCLNNVYQYVGSDNCTIGPYDSFNGMTFKLNN